MKTSLFSIFAFLITGFLFNSCNENVDLIGDFEETAVIYGLLDQSDSVHIIKINRAFVGPGNALEIATIPDSNYFESVDAVVEEYIGGSLTRSWSLDDTLIEGKDEGVFFGPEQIAYVFYTDPSDPLTASATYKLRVDINNGLFEVNGETELVSGISNGVTDQPTFSFKFASDPGEYKSTSISTDVGNSFVVNAAIEVHYTEFVGAVETPKSFLWTLGEVDCEPDQIKVFTANGRTFYELIADHCANNGDPLADKRNFKGFTTHITGGAEDLYNYILVNEPSSSLAQNKPTFTNLTATNGHPVIGIFSARYRYSVYHEFSTSASQFVRCLDKKSTQELCIGGITGPYLFCSQHDQDVISGESWACN